MSVDTRDKRMSIIGLNSGIDTIMADPDGTIDSPARLMLLGLYAGITVTIANFIKDLINILEGGSGLTDLTGYRFYPNRLPQSPTLPAIVYRVSDAERVHSTDGASGLFGPRVIFDCWAATADAAEDVFTQLRYLIDGQRSGNLLGMFFSTERSAYEFPPDAYRRTAEYSIWYSEVTG